MLNLLQFLRGLLTLIKSGESPVVQEKPVNLTSTLSNIKRLNIRREKRAGDAIFGTVTFGDEFICYSLENAAFLVEPGLYTAQLDMSPHLGYRCPHLRVPKRDLDAGGDAGLRVHVANRPSELQGCIAVGLVLNPDSLGESKLAFDRLMALCPQAFEVSIF